MRALFFIVLFTLMSSAIASIGASLDSAKKKYGAVHEVSTYRPDLYPTSYVFQTGDAKIEVTPLPSAISRMDVFFERTPSESPEVLLERYSGRAGWKSRPLSNPEFTREFPAFSTKDSRNAFFEADGVFALVQRDVGGHKLVLAIQSADYLKHLDEYRKKQKKPE
jgi:hypothetical protein